MASFVFLVLVLCVSVEEIQGRACLGDNFIGCTCEEQDYMTCAWIYFQGNEVSLDSLSTSVVFIQDDGVDVSEYNVDVWPNLKEAVTPLGTFICRGGYCMLEDRKKNKIATMSTNEASEFGPWTVRTAKIEWEILSSTSAVTINTATVVGRKKELSSMATTTTTTTASTEERKKELSSVVATTSATVSSGERKKELSSVTASEVVEFETWNVVATINREAVLSTIINNEENNTHSSVFTEMLQNNETDYIWNSTSDQWPGQSKSKNWKNIFLIISCISGIVILLMVVIMVVGYIYMKRQSNITFESPQHWEWADL